MNLVADLTPYNPFAFVVEPGYEYFPFVYPPAMGRDLGPYRSLENAGAAHAALLAGLNRQQAGYGWVSGGFERESAGRDGVYDAARTWHAEL